MYTKEDDRELTYYLVQWREGEDWPWKDDAFAQHDPELYKQHFVWGFFMKDDAIRSLNRTRDNWQRQACALGFTTKYQLRLAKRYISQRTDVLVE